MPDVVSAFNALAVSTEMALGDALAPYALFYTQKRTIGTIAIDVPIRELHDDSFVITQNPTQAGYAAADGYFAAPKRLEMTCGFSDSTAGYEGYVQEVYAAILALAEMKQPFSVSTGKRLYDNLMIENISVRTDPTTEYALDITVRLQEFIITDTDAGSATPQGANQANPASTGTTTSGGQVSLQPVSGTPTIAGYTTPVTTPMASGGIGSA